MKGNCSTLFHPHVVPTLSDVGDEGAFLDAGHSVELSVEGNGIFVPVWNDDSQKFVTVLSCGSNVYAI